MYVLDNESSSTKDDKYKYTTHPILLFEATFESAVFSQTNENVSLPMIN